ncbi:MAG: HD domain-containing protein [Deltaproteobacteria bacterium]|nr:HD domain-containing protein [Deltaproteobacteria bacterium]MBW2050724.1 HD domain-containing protein [Deltaproteobacteria bacterium]MBW2139787.1 HD domain-containing protein [Deltaproteobacteria bacterium]MBW2322771.1 HD domain-containing protein [Deltaproteobacteria bacterium]
MEIELIDLRKRLDEEETQLLSPRAGLSRDALRRRLDKTADQDHRQNYAIDVDRILHSLAFTRYIDKTQVFYLIKDDHISHRVLHVQLVSRIARTVGRYLKLNLDLIEAIALGHDLGHAPFGHDGETYLSRLCQEHQLGHFVHEVQSVEFLEAIERKGRGLNLSLQVLDGILAHDGEVDIGSLGPDPELSFDELDRRVKAKIKDPSVDFMPMTFEGCVVRLADTISYIGRDIEDAIRLGLIKRHELPVECVDVLGDTNGKIVYALVTDLIKTSLKKDFVAFSPQITEALIKLKDFNRERIYFNKVIKAEGPKIENLFKLIFERLLDDMRSGQENNPILNEFLKNMAPVYMKTRPPAAVVRDFIAGMTDEYFLAEGKRMLLPKYQDRRFS